MLGVGLESKSHQRILQLTHIDVARPVPVCIVPQKGLVHAVLRLEAQAGGCGLGGLARLVPGRRAARLSSREREAAHLLDELLELAELELVGAVGVEAGEDARCLRGVGIEAELAQRRAQLLCVNGPRAVPVVARERRLGVVAHVVRDRRLAPEGGARDEMHPRLARAALERHAQPAAVDPAADELFQARGRALPRERIHDLGHLRGRVQAEVAGQIGVAHARRGRRPVDLAHELGRGAQDGRDRREDLVVLRARHGVQVIHAPGLGDALGGLLRLGLPRAVELHGAQRAERLARLRVRRGRARARVDVTVGAIGDRRVQRRRAAVEDAVEGPHLAAVPLVAIRTRDRHAVLRGREGADVVVLHDAGSPLPAVVVAQRHVAGLVVLERSFDEVDQVHLAVAGQRAAARKPACHVAVHVDLDDRAAVEGAALALPRAREDRQPARANRARRWPPPHPRKAPHLAAVAALVRGVPARAEQRVAVAVGSEREHVRDPLVRPRALCHFNAAVASGTRAALAPRCTVGREQLGRDHHLDGGAVGRDAIVGTSARAGHLGRAHDEAMLTRALLDQGTQRHLDAPVAAPHRGRPPTRLPLVARAVEFDLDGDPVVKAALVAAPGPRERGAGRGVVGVVGEAQVAGLVPCIGHDRVALHLGIRLLDLCHRPLGPSRELLDRVGHHTRIAREAPLGTRPPIHPTPFGDRARCRLVRIGPRVHGARWRGAREGRRLPRRRERGVAVREVKPPRLGRRRGDRVSAAEERALLHGLAIHVEIQAAAVRHRASVERLDAPLAPLAPSRPPRLARRPPALVEPLHCRPAAAAGQPAEGVADGAVQVDELAARGEELEVDPDAELAVAQQPIQQADEVQRHQRRNDDGADRVDWVDGGWHARGQRRVARR